MQLDSRSARKVIVSDLKKRLVGPFEEDELLDDRPSDVYHTGSLAPVGTEIDQEEDDQEDGDSDPDTGAGEAVMTLANLSQQSAMGMSFQIAPDCEAEVILEATWAEYSLVEDGQAESLEHTEAALVREKLSEAYRTESKVVPTDTSEKTKRAQRKPFGPWQREVVSKSIRVAPGQPIQKCHEHEGIQLRVVDRMTPDARIITFSLINTRKHVRFPKDNRIHQVQLNAFSEDESPVFVARPPSGQILDEEFWLYEVIYRSEKELAIGHGCSVTWERVDGRRTNKISTVWIPEVEVKKADASVLMGSKCLLLDELSDLDRREQACKALEELVEAYSVWIQGLVAEKAQCVAEFEDQHAEHVEKVCSRNIDACKNSCGRLTDGIELLRTDINAWRAFCLANKAMAESMRISRPNIPPSWRAFQIAFILVCLPSTLKDDHELRNVLDLIWFPTGGGKTEAYLGLAAACIFYRQLTATSHESAMGTCVLTRYTLRLLTIQQFERATRMICACELVRREIRLEQETKGNVLLPFDVPISAGLFVGSGATPNKIEKAKKLLSGEEEDDTITTLPLSECPWCETELLVSVQAVEDDRLLTPCPNDKCEFSKSKGGLPIAVVDEQVYRESPTMIVGTIDKFARMAWEPRIKKIFGVENESPPNLIIQDELHLISDALGTLAALYETAIDYLCSKSGRPPKIIGSTATIRRAKHQCRRLFDREARQFPPSGLDAANSFFYKSDEKNPGRLYLGIHAQGRSPKHSLVWTVGTLGQSATRDNIPDEKIRDDYHTLVLYFNSLRELGGALVLAEDDVPRFLESVVPDEQKRRSFHQLKELTGQVPSSEIKSMLKGLNRTIYDDDLDFDPLDLVFSTNMISVGIDVDRLGVMVVNGQPKTTSEYIQASSRVGRPTGSAGLVVTLYNWTRPRDRSHYERFTTYHSSFYRNVESVSVTPFAARARDRALHAVLVSMVRLLIPELSDISLAYEIRNSEDLREEVRRLIEIIVNRAEAVDPDERDATEASLNDLLEEWVNEADHRNEKLVWSKYALNRKVYSVLRNPDSKPSHGLWKTAHSMRDVQAPSPVRILTQNQFKKISEGS